jgi:hypothetical protein
MGDSAGTPCLCYCVGLCCGQTECHNPTAGGAPVATSRLASALWNERWRARGTTGKRVNRLRRPRASSVMRARAGRRVRESRRCEPTPCVIANRGGGFIPTWEHGCPPSRRTGLTGRRSGRDSNPRYGFPYTAFPVLPLQPLEHRSVGVPPSVFRTREVSRWFTREAYRIRRSAERQPTGTPHQHAACARFFPTRPIFSILEMYSQASGTWHDVSPMSTSTAPIALPIAFAFAVSGAT